LFEVEEKCIGFERGKVPRRYSVLIHVSVSTVFKNCLVCKTID